MKPSNERDLPPDWIRQQHADHIAVVRSNWIRTKRFRIDANTIDRIEAVSAAGGNLRVEIVTHDFQLFEIPLLHKANCLYLKDAIRDYYTNSEP